VQHAVARLRYSPASQLSGIFLSPPKKTNLAVQRSPTMDAPELRRKAAHYRRVASLVSDEIIAMALLDLAAT
jgi:hypothetical protein